MPIKRVLVICVAVLGFLLGTAEPSWAVTRTWDGAPDGGGSSVNANWTNAQNWVGDVAPSAGDTLVFPTGAAVLSANNDFPSFTSFGITFTSPSLGLGYTLTGNGVLLSSLTHQGHETTITLPLRLSSDLTIPTSTYISGLSVSSVDLNGNTLTTTGPGMIELTSVQGIGGASGAVVASSSGTPQLGYTPGLYLGSGPHTFTGSCNVVSGVLGIAAAASCGVNVTGGTYVGGGSTGAVNVTGGTLRPSVPNFTIETAATSLAMGPSATFAHPGTIEIAGTVNLGGAQLLFSPLLPVSNGQSFQLIDNDGPGPIVGTFAGLPEGYVFDFNGQHFRITYTASGNDVAVFATTDPVGPASPTPSGNGYWLVATDGGIFAFGDAAFKGSTGAMTLNKPIVSMAPTPSGNGYWLVATDGGIFAFGDAAFKGSTGAMTLNKPIVSMAPTPSGNGYWLVATDGGIFAFGDAAFKGSTGAMTLNKPIVSMAPTPSGNGYWLVATDGGIFAFGDAAFKGSTGATTLNKPIVSMAPTPSGNGYWLVATDGGIFAFGDAAFKGSTGAMTLNKPIVSMAPTPSGNGYWLVATDGGIFAFGDAAFKGSTGATTLNKPIVSMATV